MIGRRLRKLERVAKKEWGLGYTAMLTIYKGVFVSIATYAAETWYEIANKKDWRTLGFAQRFAVIRVSRAYNTISVEASQVIN